MHVSVESDLTLPIFAAFKFGVAESLSERSFSSRKSEEDSLKEFGGPGRI